MRILSGIKIIGIEGLGPARFCGMHLVGMGASMMNLLCSARDRFQNERAASVLDGLHWYEIAIAAAMLTISTVTNNNRTIYS